MKATEKQRTWTSHPLLARWPLVLSLMIVLAIWWFLGLPTAAAIDKLSEDVSGLAAILLGFVCTFYVFFISSEAPFIAKIRKTNTYVAILKLLKSLLVLCGVLVVASVALHAFFSGSEPYSRWDAGILLVWIWLTIFTLLVFWRCVRHFLVSAEADRHRAK
jgi:hypothetical protein